MRKQKIITIIAFIVLFSVGTFPVFAASFDLPNISCPAGINCTAVSDAQVAKNPAAYIARLYQIALAIAGALAVGIIVVGSLFYTFAGGSTDRQREGKEMITAALWGIALLFGSYLILNTVNPNITKRFGVIDGPKTVKTTSTSAFSVAGIDSVRACDTWKIAGRKESCLNVREVGKNREEACKIEMEQYNEKILDCREKFEDEGGGMYIFRTIGRSIDARCHPFFKDFNTKVDYNTTKDSTNSSGWTAPAGEWFFCNTYSFPTK